MTLLKMGDILADIGRVLAEARESDSLGIFLYAEAGDGWASPSVFDERSDHIRYLSVGGPLGSLICDVWEDAPPDRKWAAMFYTLDGDAFDANFQYEDSSEWDPEESILERRPRVLQAKYGDKPVVFPHFDEDEGWR